MPMFRPKRKIEAHRWFKNGDHPEDGSQPSPCGIQKLEGLVVSYFDRESPNCDNLCYECGDIMLNHGWIYAKHGGYKVCPGDWIIKDEEGRYYSMAPNKFEKIYERVNDGEKEKEAQEA